MSRFFASGYALDSSSEEEALLSSSDDELVSSQEEFSTDSEFDNDDDDSDDSDSDSDYGNMGASYFLKKDFLKKGLADLDLDSEGEGRKVVKSSKDKMLDDMKESVDAIYNSQNLENWVAVVTEFDRVGRTLIRANQQKITVPNFYFKMLGQLETAVFGGSGEKSKLPADQNRALNTLKQRLKKQTKEFARYLEIYYEQPELFDSEEPLPADLLAEKGADGAVVGAVSGTVRQMSPVFTTLKLISETRGKRNIDKYEHVAVLEGLLQDALKSGRVFDIISVYQMLLSLRFDAALSQTYMATELWKKNEQDLFDFLALLEKEAAAYQVSELGAATDDVDIEPTANSDGVKVILGSISAIVERLDDEFTKCLQNTDPHLIEYVERLKDEGELYSLIARAQVYVESTLGSDSAQLARLVVRRLEHIYYKPEQLVAADEKAAWENSWKGLGLETSALMTQNKAPADVVDAMRTFLVEHSSAWSAQYATLASVYYLAVNSNYSAARELYLLSQIYAQVATAESSVQVLFNRALVQLGLAALRAGLIDECHQILAEIVNSQRVKELLGQGFSSKYPSQATAAEKAKLLPFHMHINLELLECVFTTALMLIEVPAIAATQAAGKDSRKKSNIKSFKSKLEFYDRQYFTGPPESIKDHLIYASRYLQRGNWSKAYELLLLIKIWRLFADHAQLLDMLKHQLQVEGLRTYIHTYKQVFSRLSLAKLASQFALDQTFVHETLEKMLAAGDFGGSLDEHFINFATDEPQRSKLQELAILMNEKVGLLNDKNEKTASNGHSRKQNNPQQQQVQQQQKELKESLQEENSKFRHANVSTVNDEFQATA